jgi:hypothetical protein
MDNHLAMLFCPTAICASRDHDYSGIGLLPISIHTAFAMSSDQQFCGPPLEREDPPKAAEEYRGIAISLRKFSGCKFEFTCKIPPPKKCKLVATTLGALHAAIDVALAGLA